MNTSFLVLKNCTAAPLASLPCPEVLRIPQSVDSGGRGEENAGIVLFRVAGERGA